MAAYEKIELSRTLTSQSSVGWPDSAPHTHTSSSHDVTKRHFHAFEKKATGLRSRGRLADWLAESGSGENVFYCTLRLVQLIYSQGRAVKNKITTGTSQHTGQSSTPYPKQAVQASSHQTGSTGHLTPDRQYRTHHTRQARTVRQGERQARTVHHSHWRGRGCIHSLVVAKFSTYTRTHTHAFALDGATPGLCEPLLVDYKPFFITPSE